MFESIVLVKSPPEEPPVGERWSTYLPDGLLGDILSVAEGGSSWDRLERIGGWEKVIAWAQASQIREIARYAVTAMTDPAYGDDPEQMEASAVAEVGLMTRLAPRTAAARVVDAMALVERLPETLCALSEGRISLPAARAIAEGTSSLADEHLAEVQARVLARAGSQTPGQIRAATRRAVARADAEALRRRAAQAVRERHVKLIPEPDGMATVTAYLPAPDAVSVYGVLEECARRARGPEELRGMDALRADALVDLITDRFACPDPGARPSPEQALAPASTTGEQADDASTARAGCDRAGCDRVGCDGEDPLTGALLDYSHTRYRPPPHLAEHLIARDQTCDFPSCRIPAHREPYPVGEIGRIQPSRDTA